MKIEYRNRYIANLYASLHTLSGKSDYLNEMAADVEPIVKSCSKKKVRGKDESEYYLQMNPNKALGTSGMIRTYSDFNKILTDALDNMESLNFRITRADLSFNSDNSEDYELFKKLNRLLICCIADAYNIKNCYKTSDLWTDKSLSIAIKNDVIEAENYDKDYESGGSTEAKNRLELRSKRIGGNTLQQEFLNKWFERLDKAVEHFEAVQNRYNAELVKNWKLDAAKPEKDRSYLSLTSFLMQNKDCIFTKRQLQSFFEEIGAENPSGKAKNFKDRHRIEFFSKTDLVTIIEALKNATQTYFFS